jgi:hypothetical protein
LANFVMYPLNLKQMISSLVAICNLHPFIH